MVLYCHRSVEHKTPILPVSNQKAQTPQARAQNTYLPSHNSTGALPASWNLNIKVV